MWLRGEEEADRRVSGEAAVASLEQGAGAVDRQVADVHVTLTCPSCEGDTDEIQEGVCPACRYALLGGDLAPTEVLLAPSWSVRIGTASG
jgi:hypothetical protein